MPFDAAFLDARAAARAVDLVMPMMTASLDDPRVGQSGFLHVVIMHPLADPQRHALEASILYEASVGDRAKWDADYAAYARGKAEMAWRTRMDGHAACALYPHLLRQGMQPLWGSVYAHGIAVGVSGANPWFDEAFAGAVAYALRAVAKEGVQSIVQP
ncbi:hypothetical protein V8Z80_03145 [Orrella sp. JC864]